MDAESDHNRPLKRTRQACDPCRRKKSKCSGERPVCGTCDRLRTRCSYSPYSEDAVHGYRPPPPPPPSHQQRSERPSRRDAVLSDASAPASASVTNLERWTESQESPEERSRLQHRVDSLESTLAEVLASLRHRQGPDLSPPSTFGPSPTWGRRNPAQDCSPDAASLGQTSTASNSNVPRDCSAVINWDHAPDMAKLYLQYCDCQPLPLFRREDFVSSFPNRDVGVVCAVFALASRFAIRSSGLLAASLRDPRQYFEPVRHRVMAHVTAGTVELATLQALCLLALENFHNGETAQLRIHASLATTLARCARLHQASGCHREERIAEEQLRCYWSVVLLQRLTGDGVAFSHPSHGRTVPRIPASATVPLINSGSDGQESPDSPEGQPTDEKDGILHVVLKLSEVWSDVQLYVQDRGSPGQGVPPWASNSPYSQCVEAVMTAGSKLASIHRYRYARLYSVGSEQLETRRDYWGPWLMSRLMYHTSVCIINHPILITMQLQNMENVPELFLQQTSFQRDHHTAWVLHFIDFVSSRHFVISDPLFAYCVSVLATIELHQSFGEHGRAAAASGGSSQEHQQQKHRQNYDKCLGAIFSLSNTWPSLNNIAERLQALGEDLAASYESNVVRGDEKIRIDISSFFSILDITQFCSSDRRSTTTQQSIFGPTLSTDWSTDRRRNPGLQRLPRITEPDGNDRTDGRDEHGAIDLSDAAFSSDQLLQMSMPDENMMFPADQIFGGVSPRVNPWDIVMNTGGNEALQLNSMDSSQTRR